MEDVLAAPGADPLEKAASLSDGDVLAMADCRLKPAEQQRLNELLGTNGEGQLTGEQQAELDSLMKLCDAGTLRKSIGWAEAVRRGLRKSPLEQGARLVGTTAVGRPTVLALHRNDPAIVAARQIWIAAGWHPPPEDAQLP